MPALQNFMRCLNLDRESMQIPRKRRTSPSQMAYLKSKKIMPAPSSTRFALFAAPPLPFHNNFSSSCCCDASSIACHLQEGKVVSKSKVKDAWGMPAGAELELGNWELQVDATMDEQHFRSASCSSTIVGLRWARWRGMFTDTALCFATLCTTHVLYVDSSDTHQAMKTITNFCRLGQCFMQPAQSSSPLSSTPMAGLNSTSFQKPLLSLPSATNPKATTAGNTIKQQPAKPAWQHSPEAPGAIILNNAQWQKAGQQGTVVPVVVDPYIAKSLRPHQVQGVHFLYECIMGVKEANRQAPSASFAYSLTLVGCKL